MEKFTKIFKIVIVLGLLMGGSQAAKSQCNASTGVGGTVFRDFNHNGSQDPATADFLAETGFANVMVTAFGDNGAVLGTATTDVAGEWFINGLPAGERVWIQYEQATGTGTYQHRLRHWLADVVLGQGNSDSCAGCIRRVIDYRTENRTRVGILTDFSSTQHGASKHVQRDNFYIGC